MTTHTRGPLSSTAWALMLGEPADPIAHEIAGSITDPLGDDDLQLALFLCYELHYRGLDGVDDRAEWDPSLLMFRLELERIFEAALRERVSVHPSADPVDVQLRELIASDDAPSVSSFLAREGTIEMFREFLMHRSAYHLKEADPHSFAIPRLRGRPKAAMVEIQADEYGGGDATWMHSALFAGAMSDLGLDPTEGRYVPLLPGVTLATVNLMSLFGLHRRLRGSAVGHLAILEMTSCIPNRRYGDGLRRLGFVEGTTRYFDEHVEADAAHGSIAANDMAGSLVDDDPRMLADVLFGASALLTLDERWAKHVIDAWREGRDGLWTSPATPQMSVV
ncbi:MAG TPA: iron-containing redox enzyme family protein [Actinomycetota bacterium]|nr:iron-containing redox enzyme family protein [Actinomycetota bacterium]